MILKDQKEEGSTEVKVLLEKMFIILFCRTREVSYSEEDKQIRDVFLLSSLYGFWMSENFEEMVSYY